MTTKIIDFSIDPEAVKARVAKNNAKFRKLTKAQKRVAIAKDVLLQLKARRINARTGQYLWAKGTPDPYGYYNTASTVLTAQSCNACALGALFCGLLDNTEDHPGHVVTVDIRNTLAPYFSSRQLGDIESAFEGGDGFGGSRTAHLHFQAQAYADGYVGINFFPKWENDEDRLRAIMNNIIRNKGKFVTRKVKVLKDKPVRTEW